MTIQELIDNGYKRYLDNLRQGELYIESYQKRMEYEGRTKYFLNIDIYDMTKVRHELGQSFSSYVQFTDNNDQVFNVELIHDKETTIATMEKFYNDTWHELGCKFYKCD